MTVSHSIGAVKKLKRTPWRFQRTFHTPLRDLDRFVATIASAHPEMSSASLIVEGVAFEPKHPPSFVTSEAWRTLARDITVAADSHASARLLLVAALSDWIDFFFIPEPKTFVIYADHDEYCTFYANRHSHLNRVCDALSTAAFQMVDGYERPA